MYIDQDAWIIYESCILRLGCNEVDVVRLARP